MDTSANPSGSRLPRKAVADADRTAPWRGPKRAKRASPGAKWITTGQTAGNNHPLASPTMGDDRGTKIGVEEEFHVVDVRSRSAAPEVDALLAELDADSFFPELQRSLVEANTEPCDTLDE